VREVLIFVGALETLEDAIENIHADGAGPDHRITDGGVSETVDAALRHEGDCTRRQFEGTRPTKPHRGEGDARGDGSREDAVGEIDDTAPEMEAQIEETRAVPLGEDPHDVVEVRRPRGAQPLLEAMNDRAETRRSITCGERSDTAQ